MSNYFLTGGTGAVGSAIVPLLLTQTDSQVWLLMRARDDVQLQRRLQTLVDFWGWRDSPGLLARVHALRGDAAEPGFGLDRHAYTQLVSTCTHILHCAGVVRMNLPWAEARHAAVGSTQQILQLTRDIARNGRTVKLEFVSTLGIAGKHPGVLPETWIQEARSYHNTYEQAKAEAETLVQQAMEQEGLAVTVHRPSMVVGDSRDGRILHYQIFYYICEFLSGRRTLGLYPDFEQVRLDVIPVDWVAEAIVASSRLPDTAGRIFHLCGGFQDSPRLSDLKQLVRQTFRQHGLNVPPDFTLPRSWFARCVRLGMAFVPEKQRKALSTLPIYLDYLADQQGFGNPAYKAWLASRGLSLPKAEEYLPQVLRRYLLDRYPPDA